MAQSRDLGGRLEDFHLVELVQAMDIDGSSGALYLERDDRRRGVIYFENGALAWCKEYHSEPLTLGAVLQELDMADSATIDAHYAQGSNDPLIDPLGQQMVATGALTQEQLDEALRTQMIWTVREMSRWTPGTYRFSRGALAPLRSGAGSPSPVRAETHPIDASSVSLEIVRYQYEWNELQHWLPGGMHTELRMAVEPPANHQLIFPAIVWRIISRVNAFHSPRQIAVWLHMPEMDVARVLAPLVRESLLYAIEKPISNTLPAVARPLPQTVDLFALISHMLQEWFKRKSLVDQLTAMGLFINWTMDDLEASWRQNNRVPSNDSLANLMRREHCGQLPGYTLVVINNRVDLEDLARNLRALYDAARKENRLDEFSEEAFRGLNLTLLAAFVAINRRIDDPDYRRQYESTWMAMFDEIHEKLIKK